jgi:hypothetical protein
VVLENCTTGWTATLKSNKRTKQPTKKERKTKQNSKENTETRRGEKERQSLSFLPDKAAQGGRRTPLRRWLKKKKKKKLGSFRASLSKQDREALALSKEK